MENRKTKLKLKSLMIFVIICSATTKISSDCVIYPYPPGIVGHSMIYDSINDLVIVYGGQDGPYDLDRKYFTRVYDYNNNKWTRLNTDEHPYPSTWGVMAYDSESAKIIQFGGVPQNDYSSSETWIYDTQLNTWTNASPIIHPDRRTAHVMAYDYESDVVILHGGAISVDDNPRRIYMKYNDTWAYDYNSNTWTNMNSTGLDVGVAEAQMVYDSESDRCIMVGGYYIYPYDDPREEYHATETWAYDFNSNNWENITTTPHPQYRYDHSLAYDSESDRVILFGGWTYGDNGLIQNETWVFDYNTKKWEKMLPTYSPRRIGHKMTYDAESDLVILFGGLVVPDLSKFYNTVFTYDYNANNWTIMPSNLCPTTDDTTFLVVPAIASFLMITALVLRRRKE